MTESDREIVLKLLADFGCGDPAKEEDDTGASVICATTPEQLCVGFCGGGQYDMPKTLPGTFGPGSVEAANAAADVQALRIYYEGYWQCAHECIADAVVVDSTRPDAAAKALSILKRCGVVQLAGGYDLQLLGEVQNAIDDIGRKPKLYKKLLSTKQLHDGRYQVYLPYREPFNHTEALGANAQVLEILEGYFAEKTFGIDHVSVLVSASPSGTQSLHPDVMWFSGLSVSVHTALVDVTPEMGPTFFCPCTAESIQRETWPGSAAVKATTLQMKECFGPSFAPKFVKKGTITIYDGAMFHQGLANGSGKDRPVLKLEVGAKGFPEKRGYIASAPPAGKKQALLFREGMGPPRMGT